MSVNMLIIKTNDDSQLNTYEDISRTYSSLINN